MVGLFAGEDLIDEMVWYRALMIMGQGKTPCTVCSWTLNRHCAWLIDLGMLTVRVLGNDTATHLVPAPARLRGTRVAAHPGEAYGCHAPEPGWIVAWTSIRLG